MLHTYFREDEALALIEAECPCGLDGWRRWEEMRESRGPPSIDSHSTLTYLNPTPPATERCQGFLTRQDFLYTQIIQGVSQRMEEKF